MDDITPRSAGTERLHDHKFYAFQVKSSFEPTGDQDELGNALYIMVEYVYSACNCGVAKKARAE